MNASFKRFAPKRSISKKTVELIPTNPKNKWLIDEFDKLKKQIRYDIDHTGDRKKRLVHSFRLQAIDKVIAVLLEFEDEITSSAQLKGIKGIGKGTLDRIDEILSKGKLSEIIPEILDQEYLQYMEKLTEVYGVGQRKAYELYKDFGIKSIDDLKKAHAEGKISLPDAVVKGLKYYGIVQDDIPRSEIMEIDKYLHQVLLEIDPELFGVICGSFRRLKLTSGDIDMLIVHSQNKSKKNYLAIFIKQLFSDGFLIDWLTDRESSTKFMGYCKYKDHPVRRIDIRFISPYSSYFCASVYFTGPKDFNRRMRSLALTQNFSLSEYGLKDIDSGKIIYPSSEKELFNLLGMEYIRPENRK